MRKVAFLVTDTVTASLSPHIALISCCSSMPCARQLLATAVAACLVHISCNVLPWLSCACCSTLGQTSCCIHGRRVAACLTQTELAFVARSRRA